MNEQDVRDASPIQLDKDPANHALLFLNSLYDPDDVLFLGTKFDTGVKTVREWKENIFNAGTAKLPHFIPNPVTGKKHPIAQANRLIGVTTP